MSSDQPTPLWYDKGLNFSCVPGCRRCCGGSPGYVWVTDEEIAGIAQLMQLSLEAFERLYVRTINRGFEIRKSLKEQRNYDCILLDEKGCSVYAARPSQCRTYPFWPELLDTEADWESEKNRCPGLGNGELHPAPKLVEILNTQKYKK